MISFYPAAGGGAGGNIVLQGTAVSVLGSVFANGGAGGGGNGAFRVGLPTVGAGIPTGGGGTAGGGGGSMGFIQTYTPTGVAPTLNPAAASPAPQPNRQLPTR